MWSPRLLIGLILALLALAPLVYRAISTDPTNDASSITALPGGRIDYLPDPASALSLADVTTGAAASRFQPFSAELEAAPGTHWLRLSIPNISSAPIAGVLEFAVMYIDEANCYVSPTASPLRTGQRVPIDERSVRSHLAAINVTLPPASETVIWVHSPGELHVPSDVLLWPSAESFRRYEQRQVLPLSLYFGVWAALFAYNAFIFAVLRDRIVLLYLAYLAAFGALVFVGTNFSAYFFTGPADVAREVAVIALLILGCFTLVRFSRAFLETPRVAPRLDLALRGLQWLNGLALFLTPLLFKFAILVVLGPLLYRFALVTMIALPLVGIYLWFRRCRQAPLYVVAFACFAIGLIWSILAQIGLVAEDRTNGAPVLIGSGLELLLLGIAVAYRYRLIRDEKEQLQATYATQLERDVADRTHELLALSQNLSAANADKDRLISVIAHDVRAPLASLLAVSRALTPDQAAQHTERIQRRCTELLALVNNLLDWARLRTGQFPHEPAPLNLLGLAEPAARPVLVAAAEKGVSLTLDIPADLEVQADGHAVQSIVRNLLGNAVKFTPAGGAVTLRARAVSTLDAIATAAVDIQVSDTGVGVAPERLSALQRFALPGSAPDTQGETGAGIGLSLVRDLVAREGGAFQIESSPGRGTAVSIRLPSPASTASTSAA